MNGLDAGELHIESEERDGVLSLTWRGKSIDRHPRAVLGSFFEDVAVRAEQIGARIDMHFEELEHFNSSTITVLIQFLQNLRKKQIALTVVYSGELKWQRLSFEALKIFDKGDGLLEFRTV